MSKPLILQPGLHEIAGSIASRVLEDIQKSKAGPNPAPEDESSRAAERPEVNTENSRVEANKLSAITNRKSSPVRGIENWDGKQTVVLRHEALTSCQKDLFQKFK